MDCDRDSAGPGTAASIRKWILTACCGVSVAGVLYAADASQVKTNRAPSSESGPVTYARDVAPLLKRFCAGCHTGVKAPAGIALTKYLSRESVLSARPVFERVSQNVSAGVMPPMGAAQPTQTQRDLIANWIDSTFTQADCQLHDPGRVTLRRLNRAEYNNTIHDLLGVDFKPGDDFPNDDVGYGFDNIGDVLSLSPLLMEKYLSAAEKITAAVWAKPELKARVFEVKASDTDTQAVARRSLGEFARKAYRRPVTKEEVDRLVGCVALAEKQGESFDRGIQLGIETALVSPNFLFRVEKDSGSKSARLLTGYEMASRLSYFLWSSAPDEELYRLAAKDALQKPDILAQQVKRMLRDPKARALTDNFASQWLTLRSLSNCSPDPARFPQFNDKLRDAMRTETEMFFSSIVAEDRNVLEFLDSKYTFVNERLARLYGIEGVQGDDFRRVELASEQRGGILSQASILTLTSNPTRTSPVKRGKWVLEQILGTPPPPPPPNVPQLADDRKQPLTGTLRQRMEQHRKDPMCASCHARLDPLGFGLENYDAIGAWRTKDGDSLIDSSGALPGGKRFEGPSQLKAILKGKQNQFLHCLSEKLLTFALGRGLENYDKCAIEGIVKEAVNNGCRFSSLVTAVVRSDPFRKRKPS